jgi:hypothetical protein
VAPGLGYSGNNRRSARPRRPGRGRRTVTAHRSPNGQIVRSSGRPHVGCSRRDLVPGSRLFGYLGRHPFQQVLGLPLLAPGRQVALDSPAARNRHLNDVRRALAPFALALCLATSVGCGSSSNLPLSSSVALPADCAGAPRSDIPLLTHELALTLVGSELSACLVPAGSAPAKGRTISRTETLAPGWPGSVSYPGEVLEPDCSIGDYVTLIPVGNVWYQARSVECTGTTPSASATTR